MPMYENRSLPVFAAMRNVQWTETKTLTGQVLYTAKLKRAVRSRFGIVDACARVDGSEACSGELVFSFAPDE